MLLVLRLPLAIFLSTVVIVLQDIRRPVSAALDPPSELFLLLLLLLLFFFFLCCSTNPNPRRREKEEQRGRARTIAGPTAVSLLSARDRDTLPPPFRESARECLSRFSPARDHYFGNDRSPNPIIPLDRKLSFPEFLLSSVSPVFSISRDAPPR